MRMTLILFIAAAIAHADTILFTEPFKGKLSDGWRVLREDPAAMRINDGALELRVLPGNMWGGANDARNVLARPLPDVNGAPLRIEATLENKPTSQYEQIDLVWYFDEGDMVKIGIELVHKQLSVVMGREENGKARTIDIVPIVETSLQFRFTVRGGKILGEFRSQTSEWHTAGECELPASAASPSASIQCYQGPADAEHWARISGFRITQPEE